MGAISGTSTSSSLSNFCSSSTMGFIQSMNTSTLIIMYSMSIQLFSNFRTTKGGQSILLTRLLFPSNE